MRQKSRSAELGAVEMTCTEVREDITDATRPCPAILPMSPGANTIRCRLPRTGPASLRTVRHSAVQKSVQSVRLWGLVKEAAASWGWAEKGGNSRSVFLRPAEVHQARNRRVAGGQRPKRGVAKLLDDLIGRPIELLRGEIGRAHV